MFDNRNYLLTWETLILEKKKMLLRNALAYSLFICMILMAVDLNLGFLIACCVLESFNLATYIVNSKLEKFKLRVYHAE